MEDVIRCPSRIVGKIVDGRFEVKCRAKHCGAGNGNIVLHYFDLMTGSLIETRTFREPSELFQPQEQEALASWR